MTWHTPLHLDREKINAVQAQLAYASQFVAAVGYTLAPATADDSHTAMQWNVEKQWLEGIEITATTSFKVVLTIPQLTLCIITESNVVSSEFKLHKQTNQQAFAWLTKQLHELQPDGAVLKLIEYDYDPLPEYPVAHGAAFDASDVEAFSEYAHYFDNVLLILASYRGSNDATPLRVWPHHFDIALEIPAPQKEHEDATIGLGLCPTDSSHPAPYWYMATYPYTDPSNTSELTPPGSWYVGTSWQGAALLVEDADQEIVKRFFSEAESGLRATIV